MIVRKPPLSWRVSGPTISTLSYRTPKSVQKSCTWPKTVFVRTVIRNRLPTASPRSAANCRSIPTAAAWPMVNRWVHPLRQVHEICVQLRGEGGAGQVPNEPKVGYTHVYGAPGISGVNILAR